MFYHISMCGSKVVLCQNAIRIVGTSLSAVNNHQQQVRTKTQRQGKRENPPPSCLLVRTITNINELLNYQHLHWSVNRHVGKSNSGWDTELGIFHLFWVINSVLISPFIPSSHTWSKLLKETGWRDRRDRKEVQNVPHRCHLHRCECVRWLKISFTTQWLSRPVGWHKIPVWWHTSPFVLGQMGRSRPLTTPCVRVKSLHLSNTVEGKNPNHSSMYKGARQGP